MIVLAAWAGVAIENARLYEGLTAAVRSWRRRSAAWRRARHRANRLQRDRARRAARADRQARPRCGRGEAGAFAALGRHQPRDCSGRRASTGISKDGGFRDGETWLNDLQAEAPELRGLPTLVASLSSGTGPEAGWWQSVISAVKASTQTTSTSSSRSLPVLPRPSRPFRRWRPRSCRCRSRPPSASATVGRGSCTTRRFRSWGP